MGNDLILYTTDDGQSQFVLRELGGQLWLTQLEIAELYQTTKQNIAKHLKAIFAEGELVAEARLSTIQPDAEQLETLLGSRQA